MPAKRYLVTPGPTPVPPEVVAAMSAPMLHHRGPEFQAIADRVRARLGEVLRTAGDVLLFASSGTGAMEAAVVNLCSPGDRVLVASAGRFGERWAAIARSYGLDVVHLRYAWGEALIPGEIAARLEEAGGVRAVYVTHSETSTGVVHDVESVAAAAKDAGALVLVDAVSSLGAVPFDFDGWGIDVAVSGSQKALSASPGLAFVAISAAGWAAHETATCPRFYFDWTAAKQAYDLNEPENPWTPAISVMQGLHAALRLYFQDGREARLARHELLSRAVKEGIRAMGLDLFGEDPHRAWTVTAVRAPEGLDGNELVARVRADHGVILAPGQGPLKGKVFRIGHLGYYEPLDIVRGLAALEMTLESMGYPVKRGAAVSAAEGVFAGRD